MTFAYNLFQCFLSAFHMACFAPAVEAGAIGGPFAFVAVLGAAMWIRGKC